jgi:DNA repair exonuclease SbcCD ATPase subunit
MTYGEDSSNAVYESIDDYYTPEQPAQPEAPVIDPNNFVPREQYQQLEQQFQQIQPQLETVNRLQQAFAPQQEQIDPTQQAAINKVNELISQQLSPLQQQLENTAKSNLLEYAVQNGIARNERDGENWFYGAYGELVNKASQGDANAQNLAYQLGTAWDSRNFNQVQQILKQNLPRINNYLADTRYAINKPVQSQTIGQSFSNQGFPGSQDAYTQYQNIMNEVKQIGFSNPEKRSQLMSKAEQLLKQSGALG